MDAVGIIKLLKYARVIQEFAKLKGISLGEAMDLFYQIGRAHV